ncbi:fibronectin type III domain-containing protein, partial [Streptomyces sp. NPDC005921]
MRRVVVVCALLWVTSCGWGADGDSGRLPGAPTGVTAAAGSASTVHVMWNALPDGSGVRAYEVYRGTTKVGEVPGSQHMVDVTRLKPSTVYVFTVRARGGDGSLGPRSREVRATTPEAVAADQGPAPSGPGRAHRGVPAVELVMRPVPGS